MKKTILTSAVLAVMASGVAAPALAEKPEWAGEKPSREQVEAHSEMMKEKGDKKREEAKAKAEAGKEKGKLNLKR